MCAVCPFTFFHQAALTNHRSALLLNGMEYSLLSMSHLFVSSSIIYDMLSIVQAFVGWVWIAGRALTSWWQHSSSGSSSCSGVPTAAL
jgi:hypothetical protein